MTTLYIDSRPCDLHREIEIPIGFSLDKMGDIEAQRTGRTLEMELLSTPANDRIFGVARDIYAAERFNDRLHTARIEVDGVTLFEGVVVLLEARSDSARRVGTYRIRISDGGAEWAKRAAKCAIGDTPLDFSMMMLPTEIAATWEGERDVRFLPVSRNRFSSRTSPTSLLAVEHVMSIDDYHPFISVRAVLQAMFAEAGYTLQSRFFDSDLFRRLMFSGEYSSPDTSRQRAALDFRARRRTKSSATADALGRVAASVGVLEHSVGNVVDTANPVAVDEEGNPMSDTFCTSNSFCIDEHGHAAFRPSMSATVGFLLHLEYETDFRIESRHRLKGFDTVEVLPGTRAEFALTNGYADHRDELQPATEYTLVVFDFDADVPLLLTIRDADGTTLRTEQITSRVTQVTMPEGCSPRCELEPIDGERFGLTVGDWALYDGYVTERGVTQVEVDVRLAPEQFTAGATYRFNQIFFGGAEEGMTLTLGTGCSLAPYFSENPGYGSLIGFADVAHHRFSQLDLLAAVQQMFSLAVVTDEQQKRVIIEPFEQLYADGVVWDWSERIDYSEPIAIADAGIGVAQWRERKYLDGDYGSERYNAQHATQLGVWRTENPLYGAAERTERSVNPLFTTTASESHFSPTAPAASVMSVGDDGATAGSIDTPFTPHIVLYAGLQPLPEGQKWGYPAPAGLYPLAAFHFAGDAQSKGFTLCFEDRDGQQGLHRFFDEQYFRDAKRQTLQLSLRLTAADIEHLFTPDGVNPSMCDTFRLSFCGESSLFRLSAIDHFSDEEHSCRCRFVRLGRD